LAGQFFWWIELLSGRVLVLEPTGLVVVC